MVWAGPAGPPHTQLSKAPRGNGKLTYEIRIDNASPLVLNEPSRGRDPKRRRQSAQNPLGYLHLTAPELDCPGERRGRQDARPQERHPVARARPERALESIDGPGRAHPERNATMLAPLVIDLLYICLQCWFPAGCSICSTQAWPSAGGTVTRLRCLVQNSARSHSQMRSFHA